MKLNKVNVAVQLLPTASDIHPYTLVDKAIEIIKSSGLIYKVCPFETVLEGEYDKIMEVIKQIQENSYENGAQSLMVYIKIQSVKQKDVTIDDKMKKYN